MADQGDEPPDRRIAAHSTSRRFRVIESRPPLTAEKGLQPMFRNTLLTTVMLSIASHRHIKLPCLQT